MSSQWTNKYNIMRDLSMVQGCVPVDIDATLTSAGKPPSLNLTEETEEEFYKNCTGGGDIAGPDLGLIRQMLDIVRDNHVSPETVKEENIDKLIEISKLDPTTAPFVPQAKQIEKTNEKKPKQQKPNRNVALTSILKLNNLEKGNDGGSAIIKPVPTKKGYTPSMTESVNKVNGWFDNQANGISNNRGLFNRIPAESPERTSFVTSPQSGKSLLNFDITFKKKVSPKAENEKASAKIANGAKEKEVHAKQTYNYVPSSYAKQILEKYEEYDQMNKIVHESIWDKAERLMKENEEKQKKEAELFRESYVAAQEARSPQSVTSTISESAASAHTYTITKKPVATSSESTVCEPATFLNESPNVCEPAAILNESPAICEPAAILNDSPAISCKSPAILVDLSPGPSHESASLPESPPKINEKNSSSPVQPLWQLTTVEEKRLAVVRLPQHRHLLTSDCIVCKVRQEPQEKKSIWVIDADDRRLRKLESTTEDDLFEKVGGLTWRDDDYLKHWHYDEDTQQWINLNEESKEMMLKDNKEANKSWRKADDDSTKSWRKDEKTTKPLRANEESEQSWRKDTKESSNSWRQDGAETESGLKVDKETTNQWRKIEDNETKSPHKDDNEANKTSEIKQEARVKIDKETTNLCRKADKNGNKSPSKSDDEENIPYNVKQKTKEQCNVDKESSLEIVASSLGKSKEEPWQKPDSKHKSENSELWCNNDRISDEEIILKSLHTYDEYDDYYVVTKNALVVNELDYECYDSLDDMSE